MESQFVYPRGETRPLLDHGLVRLVDFMGSDVSVVRAARVSYDAAWRAGENEGSDHKLLNYLWANAHTTPFEAVTFTFEVMLPIFGVRQWHRHRTQSYNELSARYRQLPRKYYLPTPEAVGVQSTDNKQGRTLVEDAGLLARRLEQIEKVRAHSEAAFNLYEELLADNWPKELARMVLGTNTYTHMFTTVNLLNLLKFLTLRADSHAQYEIRVYGEAMIDLARLVVPVSVAAWEKTRKA